MIVVDPLYIVFPEIVARLDFDENRRNGSRIVETVEHVCRNVQTGSAFKNKSFPVEGNLNSAGKHEPVFPTPFVPLQARSESGIDDDPLDLVILFVDENLIVPPGTMCFFHQINPVPQPDLRVSSNLPVPVEIPAWHW